MSKGWRLIDLSGKRIGEWRVLRRSARRDYVRWVCRCRCGVTRHVRASHLHTGRSTNCGCVRYPSRLSHGYSKTPTYITWKSMRQRCLNRKHPAFARYGAIGVKICHRWNRFENFLADMGVRPRGRTLDRRDPYGDYKPSNCRWATPHQQRINRRAFS